MTEDLKQISQIPEQSEPFKEPSLQPSSFLDKQTGDQTLETPAQEKSNNLSFWIILFFLAGIKDLLEFIFGLIPVIGSLLIWIVSFLLGGLIIFLIFISGNYKKMKQAQIFLTFMGQLGDLVPMVNILPLSTITIYIVYLLNKNKLISLEKLPKIKIQ